MDAGGRGAARDPVRAHMWFALAAARGDAQAVRAQAAMAGKMTPAEIAEAEGLAAANAPAR
jgi:TPR repeat protein